MAMLHKMLQGEKPRENVKHGTDAKLRI